jgi:hypothetical protein
VKRPLCVAALAAALVSARPATAAAGEPALVVVGGPEDGAPSDAAAVQRLAAELALLGLRVSVDPAPAAAPVRARVRLEATRGRVEVLFLDVATGAISLRQVLEASPAEETPSLLVLRAVELVRAVLLPPPPAPAPAPPRGPPLAVAAAPTPAAAAVVLTLGAGVLATGGAVGGAATLAFAARVRVAGPVGLQALALAPLTTSETTAAEGRARLATWAAGGGLVAETARGRLGLDASLGGLALWLRTDGTPAAGYAETRASAVGAAVHGRAGASWALGPQLAVRADLLAGALVRRPIVTFPDSTSRPAWSRAFAGALLALEARF